MTGSSRSGSPKHAEHHGQGVDQGWVIARVPGAKGSYRRCFGHRCSSLAAHEEVAKSAEQEVEVSTVDLVRRLSDQRSRPRLYTPSFGVPLHCLSPFTPPWSTSSHPSSHVNKDHHRPPLHLHRVTLGPASRSGHTFETKHELIQKRVPSSRTPPPSALYGIVTFPLYHFHPHDQVTLPPRDPCTLYASIGAALRRPTLV